MTGVEKKGGKVFFFKKWKKKDPMERKRHLEALVLEDFLDGDISGVL